MEICQHGSRRGEEAPMTFTAEEKWKCAERECKMRIYVYSNRVFAGSMTKEKADREIALMSSIAEDYRSLAEKERLI
jgi:hypothetical protein